MTSRVKSKERSSNSYAETSFDTQFIYIEYELDPTKDSLHTLSMQFGVSISDLKRINSLINDRDIYALKTVKIPVKPNSIHTEKYSSQLKYSDQIVTRLTTSTNQDVGGDDNTSVSNDEEEKMSATPSDEDLVHVDRTSDGKLIVETELLIDDDDDMDNDTRIPLLGHNDPPARVHHSREKTRNYKEVKKYLKKFDNKLDVLKSQNNELLIKNNEQLVPIQTCSYRVERQQQALTSRRKKGLVNMNVRDTMILACIVVVLAPLVFLFYRYIYITEHTGKGHN